MEDILGIGIGYVAVGMPILIVLIVFYFNYKKSKNKHDALIEISKNIQDPSQVKELIKSLEDKNKKYIQALILGSLIGGAILFDDFVQPAHDEKFSKHVFIKSDKLHKDFKDISSVGGLEALGALKKLGDLEDLKKLENLEDLEKLENLDFEVRVEGDNVYISGKIIEKNE
tara:strand:- start:36 stop:548 length:513 start_codon:yes stop_codon:yes gene_type:complete